MVEARTEGPKGAWRRRAIINAAIALFAKNGYEGTAIREIADLASMNKGNLYYYFPAKDDLLFAIVDDLHNEFNRQFQQWAMVGASPEERLRSVLRGHAVLVCQTYQQTRITYENFRFLSEARRMLVIEKRDLYEQGMARVMAEYLADASAVATTDLGLQTRAVLGMLNWIYEWYSPTGRASQEDVASKIAEMALRSLQQDIAARARDVAASTSR
jgi:TetR/AcrR family transcriptional regulator, cholesterol catabolism regulator